MVTLFASLTYLVLAIAEMPGRPFGVITMEVRVCCAGEGLGTARHAH
jgi:hypothetical protein